MMKQCIIADFEWCVTPHPHAGRFQYFNEILSAAAVRIDETGDVLDSFYTLIRPENPDYVHPVILEALKLDRAALAASPVFSDVFAHFRAFAAAAGGAYYPICTWGSADRAALLQNLRIKGGYSADEAPRAIPPMRDLQPTLCRAAEIRQPYPGLASLLRTLSLDTQSDTRHNALSDALDTARIAAYFAGKDETRATVSPLFFSPEDGAIPPIREDIPTNLQTGISETPGDALNAARRAGAQCPVCRAALGCGTWFRASQTEQLAVCTCETDGKFLCTLRAIPAGSACSNGGSAGSSEGSAAGSAGSSEGSTAGSAGSSEGSAADSAGSNGSSAHMRGYTVVTETVPLLDMAKKRYEDVRRRVRMQRKKD